MQYASDLYALETPLIFADGSNVYKKFAAHYRTHRKGFFILAPSGAGKTHFVNHQQQPDWIDGDVLWTHTKAQPSGAWWLEDLQTIIAIDERCDVITSQARRLGFWVVGASNTWLKPDAIVLPHWSTHKRYIAHREKNNYDGGATSGQLQGVLNHRKWIAKYKKQGVPSFSSVAEAAAYLAASITQ